MIRSTIALVGLSMLAVQTVHAQPWALQEAFLPAITFNDAAPGSEQTQTATGSFEPAARDWVYLPVDVPAGVREISVKYTYDKPTVVAGERVNALDVGVFDPSGITLGNERGFRGWSGGFRDSFTISAREATPGYLPGPITPGRWYIIFGPYSVANQGLHWSADVTLRFGADEGSFTPNYAPQQGTGRGRAWYRGDMHLHTVHSDGKRLPSEVAAGARAAGLDFIASTDHNTSSSHAVWGEFATPDFLILNGEEITTRNGHFLGFGFKAGSWIEWRYRSTDKVLPWYVGRIHHLGGIAVAAHPYCPYVGCSWKFGYDGVDAIEVWNGPWTQDDELALLTWDNLLVDHWVPAIGNSDAHSEPQVIGLPQSVVLANGLERGAILDGVRRGQLWIAESSKVNLSLTASAGGRTVGIGERLDAAADQVVTFTLDVTGAEGSIVRFFSDEAQIWETKLPDSNHVVYTTKPQVSRYVRVEVRRPLTGAALPSTMVALTNPIFLGR